MSRKRYWKKENDPNWELLESVEAKRLRGHGWFYFRRILIAERDMKCERCQVALKELWLKGKTLDIHHKVKQRGSRHLRFEKSNCRVLCQPCHVIEEQESILRDRGVGAQLTATPEPEYLIAGKLRWQSIPPASSAATSTTIATSTSAHAAMAYVCNVRQRTL